MPNLSVTDTGDTNFITPSERNVFIVLWQNSKKQNFVSGNTAISDDTTRGHVASWILNVSWNSNQLFKNPSKRGI